MEQENINLANENESSGISLSDLFYLLKKNLLLIIIVIGVSLVCGFGYGRFINKPTYSANSSAIVQADIGSETTGYNYALALTKSFPEIIKSDGVLQLVAKDALLLRYTETVDGETKTYKLHNEGSPISEKDFTKLVNAKARSIKNNLTVTASSTSLLIYVTYKSKIIEGYTEEELVEEIRCITDDMVVKTNEFFGEKDGEGNYITPNFANKLIVMSHVDTVTQSRGLLKILLIALAAGLVLCFGFILVRYLIDDTLTSKDDIERITGAPVLAYIEKSEKKVNTVYGSK